MRAAVTAAQMKAADQRAITHYGIPSLVLMERAALFVCEEVMRAAIKREVRNIRIYAGCGNNGADGLAAARILTERGFFVETLLVGDANKTSEEHRAQMHTLSACGIAVTPYHARTEGPVPDLILDGILGAGASRPLAGDFLQAVQEINALHEKGAFVIAIDLPTGIDCDTGEVESDAVRADVTATFAFAKTGTLLYPGAAYCGELITGDIGIREALEISANYIADASGVPLIKRTPSGNKGTFGKVLVVAGSADTGGAAYLAGRAAFLTGAGMVRLLTEKTQRDVLTKMLPEALIDAYAQDADSKEAAEMLSSALAWCDTCVAGCGMGTGPLSRELIKTILEKKACHLVLDADALNLIAEDDALRKALCAYRGGERQLVITPHLAEFARLYETDTKAVSGKLLSAPAELASKLDLTVLCKDARSIIADPAYEKPAINISGNDGMATAGAGDVLAGMTGALVAQCKDGYHAAVSAAFLHGLAGDTAAEQMGRSAMCARDILQAIPAVMRLTAGEE